MKSWQILSASILRVFNNLGAAIKISLVPYAISIVIAAALWAPIGWQIWFDRAQMQAMMLSGQFPWLQYSITVLAFAIASLWVAVAWHRFILLDETPGWIPPFRGDRIWAYFLRGLLIAIVLLPILIVAGIVTGILVGMAQGNPAIALVLGLLMIFVICLIGFRLGTALPGAALKPGTKIGDAWRATAGHWGMFAALALMLAILGVGIGLISYLLGGVPILSLIWGIVINWISTIVGLSILTTLWGHFVEGRSLN